MRFLSGAENPKPLLILHRHFLRELLQSALVTFAVITLIFVVGGSLKVLHKADFITIPTFLRAIWFFVATNLDKTLPMTVLISVVLTYGRAAAENEINSMRAAGIHLFTALAPALLFGIAGTALVLHVNDRVAPRMDFTKSELIESGIDGTVRGLMNRGGNSIEINKSTHVMWSGVDELDRMLNIRIKKYKDGDDGAVPLQEEILADTARIESDPERGLLRLHLEGVRPLRGKHAKAYAEKMTYSIPLRSEVREKKLKHHTLAELVAAESRQFKGASKQRKVRTEFHERVAGAFACILFVLLGMPLAIIFRQGNRMVAFLIAFLIAIVVYYPTFILGEVLADETDMSPVLAIWSGSIGLLTLGLGLTVIVLRR